LPLAIPSAVWFSLGGPNRSRLNVRSHPLFEFHLSQECHTAEPSQPAAARQLLSWAFVPYSTSGIGGQLAAGFACPLRSTFRVWLPSWRFTPSEPLPVLFHTGGALGIHPSEINLPKGIRSVSASDPPTYRSPCRCSQRRSDGPARQSAVSGR
jgi:hypothetical protein